MKHVLVIIGIILAITSIVMGSYMPFHKAQIYIHAMNNLSNVKTIDGFKESFDRVFNFYSPIGGEESFKFLSNNIIGFISNKDQPEAVSRTLVDYVEPRSERNNVIHLLTLANMYKILWQNYGLETDYKKTESYLREAMVIGPKLPPVLYFLLDIYVNKGDAPHAKEIAGKILELWPSDAQVEQIYSQIK